MITSAISKSDEPGLILQGEPSLVKVLQTPVHGCLLQADEASLRYHDQSVNENDHLEHALAMIKETRVFSCLDAEAQRIIRSTVIEMVLKVSFSNAE